MKFASPGSVAPDEGQDLDLDQLLGDSRWEPLLDLLPDGVVLVDRTGLVRFINSAAENFTQLLKPEATGQSLQHLVRESRLDLRPALEAFETGAKTSQVVASTVRRNYLLTSRCTRNWAGEMTCFLILVRDLDELSRFETDALTTVEGRETDSPPAGQGAPEDSLVLCDATTPLIDRGLRALALGSRLLLLGESGAGKTEFARTLHRKSGPAGRPFVHVNCGSIPESLFESEMFGYERGSFTGAAPKGKKGLVEAAEGGVLFLDEIGEIPLLAQAKMLQFLEDSALQKVGATQSRRLRLQIIAATNRDLYAMVAAGAFRRDLYYRLGVVTLTLPPLRDCPEVIDRLADRFIARLNRRRALPLRLDAAGRRRLREHDYPGNVRELQNLMEYLAVVCDRVATERDVAAALGRSTSATANVPQARLSPGMTDRSATLKEVVRDFETRVIRDAIERAGSKRKAAELLGVDIATVVRKTRPVSP